jgi:hypothetical protein
MNPVTTMIRRASSHPAVSWERQPFQSGCWTASTAPNQPHLKADTAFIIKLFSVQVISSYADEKFRPRDHLLLCSLRIWRLLSTRCAAASNPFRAASSGWGSISSYTSMWTSPQPPASSCAQERDGSFPCKATRKRNLEDAAMVKRPILQSDGLTKPASWKNEFWNTISFVRLFLIHSFCYLSVVIYPLSPSNNPILLDHVTSQISQYIWRFIYWIVMSLPGFLLLKFMDSVKSRPHGRLGWKQWASQHSYIIRWNMEKGGLPQILG